MSEIENRVKQMAEHTFGTWNWQKNWQSPLLIKDAEGVYFYDSNGKRYLDFSSQFMCSNLGHKNQAIIKAIGSTPGTGRSVPSRPSSPINPRCATDFGGSLPLPTRRPMARGRSN